MRDADARTPENIQPNPSHPGASGLTAKRLARLALGALLGLGACGDLPSSPGSLHIVDTPAELPAPLPVQAMHFEPNAAALPLLTTGPTPDAPPRDVFWTAHEPKTVQQLASEWGLALATLTELNPELAPEARLAEGTRVKVWEFDPENPPLSIGSPNRGKLRNGMPFPEGDSWRLRPVRRRAYGTEVTVNSLVEAFEAYGAQFPDSPKIRVGEIAKRNGGRVAPHASHRSGRDVDIGYIFQGADNDNDHFTQMSARNFDVEKNWVLIQEILKSGKVQTIYVSKKLQKLLHAEAAKTLSAPELAQLFEYPRTESSPHATLQHWKGHADHMHIRFQCEDGNRRCRSRGR